MITVAIATGVIDGAVQIFVCERDGLKSVSSQIIEKDNHDCG